MFENLTDKLQYALRKIAGTAVLTENNIEEAMREVRIALLEADVNYKVVKEFIEEVKKECLGTDVLKSITPGQQVIKIVYDALVRLMGESEVPLSLEGRPAVIMMIGLHGSGKTTTSAKLAVNLTKNKKKCMLVAGDVYRPAAIEQLEVLGREINVPVYAERGNNEVPVIVASALARAKAEGVEVVIIDTAGRLQIDDTMVQELVRIKKVASPSEILLVADAAIGQEAVSVAEHFHSALGVTGVILTKLDGDARGGAALSLRKVTGCPIKFVGVGEKISDLDVFYPDRMASRILGMGDIVSLVEKAAEEIDRKEAEQLREKLKKKTFDFNDLLSQFKQMKKLGGFESILKLLPGGSQIMKALPDFNQKQFAHMEAIILSMTPHERENPDVLINSMSRRRRIAKGSGTSLSEVSQLINQLVTLKKMLKKTSLVNKIMSGNFDLGESLMDIPGKISRGSNFIKPKKRNKKHKHKKGKKRR